MSIADTDVVDVAARTMSVGCGWNPIDGVETYIVDETGAKSGPQLLIAWIAQDLAMQAAPTPA